MQLAIVTELFAIAGCIYASPVWLRPSFMADGGDWRRSAVGEAYFTVSLLVLIAVWLVVILGLVVHAARTKSLVGIARSFPYSSPEPWALLLPPVGYAVIFLFFTFG